MIKKEGRGGREIQPTKKRVETFPPRDFRVCRQSIEIQVGTINIRQRRWARETNDVIVKANFISLFIQE